MPRVGKTMDRKRNRRMSAQLNAEQDPLEDPSYQKFLTETAKHCRARHTPCAGCCAGGMCDGDLGNGRFEDEESDGDSCDLYEEG